MGFRHYYVIQEKTKVNDIRKMNLEDIEKLEERDMYVFDILGEKVFEFGKLYFDDTRERITKEGEELFKNKEVQERLCDYDIILVGKASILEAIEVYKEKIQKNLHASIKKSSLEEYEKDYDSKLELIDYMINLNEKSKKVTNSWLYEYSIFNLVFLLKTIDFEKYDLIVLGH